MSFTLLGILNSAAAGAGGKYFFSVLGTAGDNEQFFDSTIDSQGNIIVAGGGPGYSTGLLMKFDPLGGIIWQKNLANGEQFEYGVTTDSSDNIYVGSRDSASGSLIVKYDTNGNSIWQIRNKHNSYSNYPAKPVADNSGNAVVPDTHYDPGAGRQMSGLFSYDSNNGSINWTRQANNQSSGQSFVVKRAVKDSQGYVYLGGSGYYYSTTGTAQTLVKYRASDGNVEWQKGFGTYYNTQLTDIVVDANDNIYTFGWDQNYQSTILVKWNTSGQVQWHRARGTSGGYQYGQNMAVDADGNIFATGNDMVTNKTFIFKYNSSGTLLWQRFITKVYNYPRIVCDANGDFYLTNTLSPGPIGNRDALIIYLPGDGSLTGTYEVGSQTFVYEEADINNYSGQNYITGSQALVVGTYYPTQTETKNYTTTNANLTQEITNI